MNCAQIEILICDYAEGTLGPAEKAEVERHLAGCAVCAELARDSASALAFMERVAAVEPSPELITRILFDAPWAESKPKTKARAWISAVLSPIRQPKFAMSMALTVISLSMLARFVVPVRQLRPDDLKPSVVWAAMEDRAIRTWARTVKFYDNLKFVYQIQTTLREWQQQDEDRRQAQTGGENRPGDDHKLPINSNSGSGRAVDGGSPATGRPLETH